VSSKDRSVPNKLVQIALVMLGVTLIVASFVALQGMMSGGLEPTVTESMAGARSTASFSLETALALFLPLGAVASFVAFALTRYNKKGMTARRSLG
jgi:hypothetical protein